MFKPGRELDALIAKKVFGHVVIDHGDEVYYYKAPPRTCGPSCKNHEHILPYYSTERTDALAALPKDLK